MRARHVSSEAEYRTPFGAVRVGGTVVLSIDVWGDDVVFCTLRTWTDEEGELFHEMRGEACGDHLRFSCSIKPAHTGVVWYSFDIEATDGSVWRYGALEGRTCGEGAFAYGNPPSFQITVYEQVRSVEPDWYKNGVVYQVFPDRFARGESRDSQLVDAPVFASVPRAMVDDWNTPPSYVRRPDHGIARWDFYGGDLWGVVEKLDYLRGLGVTVLYLNPVFLALSNHRYDTADYLEVDPLLGGEEALRELCEEAHARGMHVVLDGVFNHCGADSRYFNRFGTFPEPGAWQAHTEGVESPYADWFTFNDDGTYAGWWGNPDMPAFRSDCEAYQELICGPDGVIRRWERLGVDGWRLDVADELTDAFIERIKAAALAEKPDALVIGEVWEDASNKRAYGQLRHYFQGRELDGVMNYPFRTALLAFMTGKIKASELAAQLGQLRENYPNTNFYSSLNLLGSHDRERLFTVLGGAPDPDSMSEEAREAYRLDDGQAGLAMGRLWATALIQMTLPGVPCIYYGDEAGLEGFRDPFNRASFPWDGVDEKGERVLNPRNRRDCFTIYRNALALRRTLPVLVDGDFEPFASGDDVFGFWRRPASGQGDVVCVLVNGSLNNARTVQVPMVAEKVVDVVSGRAPKVASGAAEVFLWPLGTAVLRFSSGSGLARQLEPGTGVLCHVTSVPNGGKQGTLGAPARAFVDWLAARGEKYWQVLPVNPADQFGSPYAGLAAFAGNVDLLEEPGVAVLVRLEDAQVQNDPAYQRFVEKNEYWLQPYCCFRAIKELVGEKPWQEWPEEWRSYDPSMNADPRLAASIEANRRLQFEFDCEWSDLLSYAHERGIQVVGDMPMYVSADSADVWSEPGIFDLDDEGYPRVMAGAPGDAFTPDGQVWGNPTYRWDVLAEEGYGWWLRRFARAFELYDVVRLDHFIGFSSYYTVPKGGKGSDGSFSYGPGLALFQAAYEQFGPLPFIAEDLGAITPAVRALVAATGIPGMDVAQFVDYDVRAQGYTAKPGTVAYTGTHDNQTLVGFCNGNKEVAQKVMDSVMASDAPVRIRQLQDVLLLGDEARMNVPGTAEGNWVWRSPELPEA